MFHAHIDLDPCGLVAMDSVSHKTVLPRNSAPIISTERVHSDRSPQIQSMRRDADRGVHFHMCYMIGARTRACTSCPMKNNNKAINAEALMDSKADRTRAYVLVELHPGKEKEFCDLILSKGLLVDSKVQRTDFVHGPFDFVMILYGAMEDIDARIMEIRKSPFVRKTETLICFEMFEWEDVRDLVNKQS